MTCKKKNGFFKNKKNLTNYLCLYRTNLKKEKIYYT